MSVGCAVFAVASVSVACEGIETTIILWGWVNTPLAITGALARITTVAHDTGEAYGLDPAG